MTPAERLAAAARGLPRGWSVRTLDEAASWYSGGTPSKAVRQYWDGPIPWVSPKDMKAFELHDVADHVSVAAAEHGTRVVPADTIFVVVRGMILAHTFPVSIAGRAMAFNQDVKGVVAKPDVHPRFLGHWFVASSHELLRLATASTHGTKKIDLPDLRQFPVRLPPPNEQRRIAEILDAADEAIASTDAVIAKLESSRAGLQDDLVAGSQAPCTEFGMYVKASAFGPRFPADAYESSGNIATLRTTDLDEDGELDLDGMPLARLSESQFRSHFLEPGDLLITRSGTCGIASVFQGFHLPVVPGAFLLRFRPKETLLAEYARYYFNSRVGRAQLLRLAEGGVQKNIRGSAVLRLGVRFPAVETQRRAVAVLDSIGSRLRAESAHLSKLRLEKQGLMQDLLTGRVRVNA